MLWVCHGAVLRNLRSMSIMPHGLFSDARVRFLSYTSGMDMTLGQFFALCIGGGLGSVARASLSGALAGYMSAAGAILSVNLSGSFLIGAVFAATVGLGAAQGGPIADLVFLFFGLGFLGGFTTVSTFALQVMRYWHDGDHRIAVQLALTSLITCPIAAFAGMIAASQLA